LAAPIGTEIQFRYTKKLVTQPILSKAKEASGQKGLVCNIDLSVENDLCPITPVREIEINNIYTHGSTITVTFKVEGFAHTDNVKSFTKDLADRNPQTLPRKAEPSTDAQGSEGFFFFSTAEVPSNLKYETELSIWENITSQLQTQEGYQNEPFYWTVLGLIESRKFSLEDADKFCTWPTSIEPNREYTILIYVFHPDTDSWLTKGRKLLFSSGFKLITSEAHDLIIDSPYDLRRWTFKVPDQDLLFNDKGWIRLGPELVLEHQTIHKADRPDQDKPQVEREAGKQGLNKSQVENIEKSYSPQNVPDWSIDLPIQINFSKGKFFAVLFLLGMLISGSSITSIILQKDLSIESKILAGLVALILGICASIVAITRLKRVT